MSVIVVAQTIAQLPSADTPLAGTEFVPISQNGVTVKVASSNLGGGGGGVTTFNGLTGSVTLAAGSNVTLTPSGNTITIAATGGAAGVSSLNSITGAVTLVAGSNITITPSGSNITIASTAAGGGFGSGRIITAAGAVTMVAGDGIVEIAQTVAAPITINLPVSPVIWQPYTVVDGAGMFAVFNATIIPPSGTIDGSGTFLMTQNWQTGTFYWNGTNWRILI